MARFRLLSSFGRMLVLLLSFARLASACDSPCTEPSVEAAFRAASLVFYGTVVDRKDRLLHDVVTFDITKLWKGPQVKSAVVSVESNTCDPMGDLAEPGESFLVFAATPTVSYDKRTGEPNELVTGFCRGSVRVMPYDQGPPRHAELTALAAGKKPGAKPGGAKPKKK